MDKLNGILKTHDHGCIDFYYHDLDIIAWLAISQADDLHLGRCRSRCLRSEELNREEDFPLMVMAPRVLTEC